MEPHFTHQTSHHQQHHYKCNQHKTSVLSVVTNVRLSPVAPNVGVTITTRFNSNFESIPVTVNSLTVTNNGSVSTTSAGTNSYGFTNCAD